MEEWNQYLMLKVMTKQQRLISDLHKRVKELEEKSAPTAREQKTPSNAEETPSGMAELLREMFGNNVTETTREGVKFFEIGKKDDGTCDCFVCRARKAAEQKKEQAEEGKTQE